MNANPTVKKPKTYQSGVIALVGVTILSHRGQYFFDIKPITNRPEQAKNPSPHSVTIFLPYPSLMLEDYKMFSTNAQQPRETIRNQ